MRDRLIIKAWFHILLTLFFCLLFTPLISDAQKYDFRKVTWGMSAKQVIKSEKGNDAELKSRSNKMLTYLDKVAGLDSLVTYKFVNGKLRVAGYIFMNRHINNLMYVQDYARVKRILIKKYGVPERAGDNWKGTSFKSEPKYFGTALSTGMVDRYAEWEFPRTEIVYQIFGDNLKINTTLLYNDKSHLKTFRDTSQKEDLNKF